MTNRTQMNKFQAREALAAEIAKRTGNARKPQADVKVITFGWFVRNRWLPLREANWKGETARDKKCILQKDLLDTFESVPLEHFDKFRLQIHLNQLAKTRSRDRVLQIRAYVRDIFAEAVDQDFLPKDPARKVEVPKQLRETDTHYTELGSAAKRAREPDLEGQVNSQTGHDRRSGSQ